MVDFFNCIFGRFDTRLNLLVYNIPDMTAAAAPWLHQVGTFKAQTDLPGGSKWPMTCSTTKSAICVRKSTAGLTPIPHSSASPPSSASRGKASPERQTIEVRTWCGDLDRFDISRLINARRHNVLGRGHG